MVAIAKETPCCGSLPRVGQVTTLDIVRTSFFGGGCSPLPAHCGSATFSGSTAFFFASGHTTTDLATEIDKPQVWAAERSTMSVC
jgi:hypothetical protein